MLSSAQITVPQLTRLIGTPDAPVLIDVRIDEDFEQDPRLLPASFRHPFHSVASLASQLTSSRVVLICQKGRKLSQGAAAVLRNHGIQAEWLDGGQFAWRDAGEPMIPAAKLPVSNPERATHWVTGFKPGIDRVAGFWLIRRFIDRNAQLLFVTPSEVQEVARRFEAIALSTENDFSSRRHGSGVFGMLIGQLGLETKALTHMAAIVRDADANSFDSAPQAAGLAALSAGLSRMHGDDPGRLDAAMPLYDALYRWARDEYNEVHDRESATGGD